MTPHMTSTTPPLTGPFTLAQGREVGLTERMIRGPRFRRLLRGIYVPVEHTMSRQDWHAAATLALPDEAHLSHVSRVQASGLDLGETLPVHFTVTRDHHLDLPAVFLHRTTLPPPTDSIGVTPAIALIGLAATATPLQIIVAADWLLHRDLTSLEEIASALESDPLRPGATEVRRLSPLFHPRAASVPESQARVFWISTGMPTPEVNVPVLSTPHSPIADLWLPEWKIAMEYEGLHHFTDPEQMKRDIERYAQMRSHDIAYLQIYRERLRHPRGFVLDGYRLLRDRGYTGPAPDFGARWRSLFAPASPTPWRGGRRRRGRSRVSAPSGG